MKKLFKIFSLLTLVSLSLISCSNKIYLEKDEDTNLKYWITQEVKEGDFKDCTFLPGMFGGSLYLDGRYEAIKDESGMLVAPDIAVTYTTTGYPDYTNKEHVTHIGITDPIIHVYGLTLKSHPDMIWHTMTDYGFKKGITDEGTQYERVYYQKDNVNFIFVDDAIYINAHVTNKDNIVF